MVAHPPPPPRKGLRGLELMGGLSCPPEMEELPLGPSLAALGFPGVGSLGLCGLGWLWLRGCEQAVAVV